MDLSNELSIAKAVEELKRQMRARQVVNKKITVTTTGIRFRHNLGIRPKIVNIQELADINVWHHQPADAKYVYLIADEAGEVILTVIGE